MAAVLTILSQSQAIPPEFNFLSHIYDRYFIFVGFPRPARMSGCTFLLARNSSLRTTLVDEATGHAKYQIDTPVKVVRSVTRIRKFDSPTHPHHWDEDSNSDPSDVIADKEKHKSEEDEKDGETGDEAEPEVPETSDEIARIYWKWFSPDRIIFRGGITTREEFLPKTGKMKGRVFSHRVSRREGG